MMLTVRPHRRVEPATSCPERRAGGKAPHPDDVDTPRAAVPRLIRLARLFAVALVRADGPIRLTAVLPGIPALPAPLHPAGLGDGERAVSRYLIHHLDSFCIRRDG